MTEEPMWHSRFLKDGLEALGVFKDQTDPILLLLSYYSYFWLFFHDKPHAQVSGIMSEGIKEQEYYIGCSVSQKLCNFCKESGRRQKRLKCEVECSLFSSLSPFTQLSLLSPLLFFFFPHFFGFCCFFFFFLDFLFYQSSSFFCMSISPLQAWHWMCEEVLPSATIGATSVHQPPLSSRPDGGGKSSTRSSRSKQITSISRAELVIPLRNSQNPGTGTQISSCRQAPLYLFHQCEGWSKSRSKIRNSPESGQWGSLHFPLNDST